MLAFQTSGSARWSSTAIPFLVELSASRHPVKAALRLAPLGLDGTHRDAGSQFLGEGMAGLVLANALPSFSLDIDRPSHGRPDKTPIGTTPVVIATHLLGVLVELRFTAAVCDEHAPQR